MASTWKTLSVRLGQLSQDLPPPVDTAVELMARLAVLTTGVLEAEGVSKENPELVELLSERSLTVSRMIELYVAESRPQNGVFTEFVYSFQTTLTEVLGFVENRVHVNGNDGKLQFADLWKRLDALAADYRGYLLQNMVSGGPSERIEHPQLREFWRQSMTNVPEAKWPQFWDQLLHDFPGTRQFLSGPSASSNKAKLQARAIPYDANLVGPWEINNLFQPPQSSVESIIKAVLADDQHAGSVAGDQRPVQQASPTNARQVQRWSGYWIQGAHRGDMNLELFFAANHKIAGGGSDEIGLFTCTGECLGTKAHFIKQYIGKHEVEYDGVIRNNVMNGTWKIGNDSHGDFHLELQSNPPVADGVEAGIIYVGMMLHWKGYYIQKNAKTNMSGDMLYTNTNNIYGSGVDAVGRFTLLGRFQQGPYSALVEMTKQYNKNHAVFYKGAVGRSVSMGQAKPKVVMEGSWALAENLDHGTFFIEPK